MRVINGPPYSTARQLAKACGRLISAKLVLGEVARSIKISKFIQSYIQAINVGTRLNLEHDSDVIIELFFWKKEPRIFKSQTIII